MNQRILGPVGSILGPVWSIWGPIDLMCVLGIDWELGNFYKNTILEDIT